jgi:multimeric flavodoxin WrbA
MNLLAISSTPRTAGNSEILLQHAIKPFEQNGHLTRLHILRDMNLHPCTACDSCRISGICRINDDMTQVNDSFKWCDAMIIASPVYSRNVCSQLMMLFDRHYAVNIQKPLKGKPGGAIVVGRGTCGGQTIAVNAIYTWMLSCGMICVPGGLNGMTAVADKPGDILSQENRLRQAIILGENILHVAMKLFFK